MNLNGYELTRLLSDYNNKQLYVARRLDKSFVLKVSDSMPKEIFLSSNLTSSLLLQPADHFHWNSKYCLVFDALPLGDLRHFVDTFGGERIPEIIVL